MKTRTMTFALAFLCAGCTPAQLAGAQSAASIAGAAVDAFALVRAEQIRAKSAEAVTAAEKGDSLGAMRALNEALAAVATRSLEELAQMRRERDAALKACSNSAPPAAPPAP